MKWDFGAWFRPSEDFKLDEGLSYNCSKIQISESLNVEIDILTLSIDELMLSQIEIVLTEIQTQTLSLSIFGKLTKRVKFI